MPWLAAFLDGIAGKNGICTDFKHMMLGSKAFDPSDTELLCTACSAILKNIRNSLIFFEKWLLTHVFGGSQGQKFSCKQACVELLTF